MTMPKESESSYNEKTNETKGYVLSYIIMSANFLAILITLIFVIIKKWANRCKSKSKYRISKSLKLIKMFILESTNEITPKITRTFKESSAQKMSKLDLRSNSI